MRRRYVWLVIGLLTTLWATAQQGNNPFELTPRLSAEEQAVMEQEDSTGEESTPGNPFEMVAPSTEASGSPIAPLTEAEPQVADERLQRANDGWLIVLTVGIAFLCAVVLIFFRSLYAKVSRAVLNDNLLGQLYREREAGALGRFLVGYILFFLSAGLFTYLVADYYQLLPPGGIVQRFSLITAALIGLFLAKHLLLAVVGYVFPIRKEIQRYSFTIMVFSILLGLILTPASFLLAFGPEDWQYILIVGTGGLVALVYLLRSLRGLFIGNRFIFSYLIYFLLYICAVEIIPALFLYKLLVDTAT